MVNLFYPFSDIEFIEEEMKDDNTLCVEVNDNEVIISYELDSYISKIDKKCRVKEEVKKSIFKYMNKITGKKLAWGTLVGIRPSKKALEKLEEGISEKEIIRDFNERYLTSKEKAKLCIDVAKWERNIVNKDEKTISIYVGMPFCPTRCAYCSFTSNPISSCKTIVEPYLQCLKKEIKMMSKYVREKELNVECVYFGGGTPTSINNEQFEDVMKSMYESFIENSNVKEFTVECGRPDSITREKLMSMKEYGVHRISINPQTMNDSTLKLIGRSHDVKSVVETFKIAKDLGFDNINMDIIVGLPGEKFDNIEITCSELEKLKPHSITVHGMSIKRASKLHENLVNNKKFEIPKQDELNKMYERTVNMSKKLDMKPYYMYRQKNMVGSMENIGYAIEGKEGIYNVQMIEEKQTIIALGADAVSKVVFLNENRIERFANVKDVREYIKRIDEMIDKKINLLDSMYN
ncbi:coproporphyrinogen III oxidase [Clostridium ihumii]|uniref:coproporphyrinogen III oxidase n=1 Tax=Clostridium ihumii TaxID=1470356 RepID=UPI000684E443